MNQGTITYIRNLEQSRERLRARVIELEHELNRAILNQDSWQQRYSHTKALLDHANELNAEQANLVGEKMQCLMLANRVCQKFGEWYQAIEGPLPENGLFEKLMHAYHEWRGE